MDIIDMNDDELMAKLEGKYQRPRPPGCPQCGSAVTLMHRGGGLPLTWVCGAAKLNQEQVLEAGKQPAAEDVEHLRLSTWLDYRPVGDARVMSLIQRHRTLLRSAKKTEDAIA